MTWRTGLWLAFWVYFAIVVGGYLFFVFWSVRQDRINKRYVDYLEGNGFDE